LVTTFRFENNRIDNLAGLYWQECVLNDPNPSQNDFL
jgi:hypothetical protein